MSPAPRVALVTGGSGGLGSAIAKHLASAGHHVLVHAHSGVARAEAVVAAIHTAGGRAEPVAFDVTNMAATRAALESVLERYTVQIIVNNAGIHDDAVFPGMSALQWQRVIDTNVNGFFNVTQPLLLPMIRTRWGRIINMSSVTALRGNRGQVNYAAAKGAIDAATRALALEVGSRGITVNAVAPGIIDAGMADGQFDARRLAQLVPLGRAGSSDEVASLVAFLASDAAAYITGQVISLNGGMY